MRPATACSHGRSVYEQQHVAVGPEAALIVLPKHFMHAGEVLWAPGQLHVLHPTATHLPLSSVPLRICSTSMVRLPSATRIILPGFTLWHSLS
jgi:hypothetical protein